MFITPPLKWPISPASTVDMSVITAIMAARLDVFPVVRFMVSLWLSFVVGLRLFYLIVGVLVGHYRWRVQPGLDRFEFRLKPQCLGASLSQFLDPLLQLDNLVRICGNEVSLLRGILRDIVKLNRSR